MYVVAYLNLHDGYLQQFVVPNCNSRREAICETLLQKCFVNNGLDPEQEAPELPGMTEKELCSYAADMDCYVHAIEI